MDQKIGAVPSAAATIFAIIGIILSLISYIVPVFGVLFVNPLAGIAVCIALFLGDASTMSLIAIIIVILKYIISPTFWLNVGAGGGSAANAMLSWVGLAVSITMIWLYARNLTRKGKAQQQMFAGLSQGSVGTEQMPPPLAPGADVVAPVQQDAANIVAQIETPTARVQPVSVPNSGMIFCASCGEQMKASSKFCGACGTAVL